MNWQVSCTNQAFAACLRQNFFENSDLRGKKKTITLIPSTHMLKLLVVADVTLSHSLDHTRETAHHPLHDGHHSQSPRVMPGNT